jgi:predicted transposase YbfD/YdcC
VGAYFESLPDPRHTRNRKHLLVDVIVIAVCGIICGCAGPTAIHRWSTLQEEWLKQHLTLANGLPSRDCLRRLLMALKPEAFQKCFQAWTTAVFDQRDNQQRTIVAIDGKTCRGSYDTAKNLGALHIVSAWACEEGIALGQVATEEKSNEITAIPELLRQLDLANAIITIDAMGCQKDIVTQIVDGGGDYIVAVKDNQPKLLDAIETHFREALERDLEDIQYRHCETRDHGHGRTDEHTYYLAKVPKDFAVKTEWPSIKAIGYALRVTQHADGTETSDVRYYISNRYISGQRFGQAVRKHWGIEAMHWVLDVNFREDDSRTRERTLGNNLSWLRRFAVSLLKRHPVVDSLCGKMFRCIASPAFLSEVLTLNGV